MEKKISLNSESCWAKPSNTEAAQISRRIASSVKVPLSNIIKENTTIDQR